MSSASAPQPGMETMHGYRLNQLLGKGGSGEVWEADAADGTRAALKFIPCDNDMAAEREFRSAEAVREMAHPNIINIKQVWKIPFFVVVAMEQAEGTLADLLSAYLTEFKTPIVREQVCLYLSQVAEALDFIHSHQQQLDDKMVAVQHREVKPSNMLLFGESVKLAEFGMAVQTFSWIHLARRTGMVDYAAPELFKGHSSAQSDQYSLAVSYCELRAGKLPFPKMDEVGTGSIRRRLEADLSMLSPEERPVIARALDRLPENRWPNCTELIERLIQAVLSAAG
jgi:serine/threonine-protein kinase